MRVELRAHGSHVGAHHDFRPMPDPATLPRETVEDDDGIAVHTRRYEKGKRVSASPRTMGRLRHIHADAIEYTGMRTEVDGLALVLAATVGMPLVLAAVWVGLGALEVVSGTDALLILGMSIGMACLGFWFCSEALDGLLFALEALPIVFDRKHRKVYRLLPDEGTGFWNVVRRRPLVACEYDWDLVDVEGSARSSTSSYATNDCNLAFRVRNSRADSRAIDLFHIGVREFKGSNLDPMWEHIRRFMEEEGPAWPDPAETLARPAAPRTWWGSLRMTGEHAPLFLLDARRSPVRALALLPLFLLGLPFRLLWGTGDYLKERTRIPVRWPAVVLERIGPCTDTTRPTAVVET